MPPPSPSIDRKSTRLNSSHLVISYAVFCLKKLIVNEPPSQTDHVVLRVTKPAIELDNPSVGRTHLQVYLRAAALDKQALRCSHQQPSVGPPAMPGGYGQIINPAAVAIEANHRSSYQLIAHCSNQKQLRLFRAFARNVEVGIIPGARQAALLPECDNGCLIVRFKGSDLHAAGDTQQSRLRPIGSSRTNCTELFMRVRIHPFCWRAASEFLDSPAACRADSRMGAETARL